MKSCHLLLLMVLTVLPLTSLHAQNRPTKKAFKGIELYSWKNSDDEWIFALVPGTNRNKTEAEVKEHPISGSEELAKDFFQLAEGEEVFWFHYGLKGFAYPDEKTIGEIVASAKKAKVELHVPPKGAKHD